MDESEALESVILANGRVIDPANGRDEVADVLVRDGRIADTSDESSPARRIDVSGCLVVPGLVDSHVHNFGGIGPFDSDALGVSTGVTTLVDAGGAGSATIDDAIALTGNGATDVYNVLYVHPSGLGQDGYRVETHARDLDSVRIGATIRAIEEHPERVRALKAGAFPDLGPEWVQVVKNLARWSRVPGYFHIGNFRQDSDVDLRRAEFFRQFEPGDIVTHIYTGVLGSILDDDGVVEPEVLRAQDRGVHFDLGYGTTGFSFDVAERALEQGVRPRTLSTDLQIGSPRRDGVDLVGIMSMMTTLGFTIEDLVPMVTSNAAAAFGLDDRGGLSAGSRGDITVLETEHGDFECRDTERSVRRSDTRFTVRLTVKDGKLFVPDPDAIHRAENRRYLVDVSAPRALHTAELRDLFRAVADLVDDAPKWDREALHYGVESLIDSREIPRGRALAAIYGAFMGRSTGPQLGWWLVSLMEEKQVDVAGRLRELAA